MKSLNIQRREKFKKKHGDPNEAYIQEVTRKIKEKEARRVARRKIVEDIILKGIHISRQRVLLTLMLVPQIMGLIKQKLEVSDNSSNFKARKQHKKEIARRMRSAIVLAAFINRVKKRVNIDEKTHRDKFHVKQ